MGGNQSWLNCDSALPAPAGQQQTEEAEGSLLLAALLLIGTVLLTLLITAIAVCVVMMRRQRNEAPGTPSEDMDFETSRSAAAYENKGFK
ncbi:hypothetical protein BOX15_Mlig015330g1 [Macrostomum lignano]|uniref:Uncharacterized protein n=1 Tax=Macrostomum lignano TaxID=282301 RepID=A0A267G1F2_9PLAT|nr:hypothetical protein BOX15_Mlig015330g1 [Macrostomum lignano]